MLTIYFHPTCATSYRVVKELSARGLLDKVKLVDVSSVAEASALREEVWSVPWITVDGEAVATDPVEPEEVVDIALEGKASAVFDPVEAFMSAVASSLYAASLVQLHGSLRPVASRRFASAALRSRLGGPDPVRALEEVLRREEELLAAHGERLVKVLAAGLVRSLWWARGGRPREPPGEDYVAAWLLAAAGLGRVGLPRRPHERAAAARPVAEYLSRSFDKLADRIDKEQSTIMGDEDYWRIVGGLR